MEGVTLMYVPSLSRRNFLRTFAMGAGAVALGSALPTLASAQDVVPGKPFTAPFASFPFRRIDALQVKITNGWTLSDDEAYVIGETSPGDHTAVDFEGVAIGRGVYAPFDGYAIQSAQFGIMNYETRFDPANPVLPGRMWKDPFTGREGYLGYGGLLLEIQSDYFIQGVGFICAQFFHIGAIEPSIPFIAPEPAAEVVTAMGESIGGWFPAGIVISQQDFRQRGKRVKTGEKVATVGDVGINHGYLDAYNVANNTVTPRDRTALPHWDPQGAGAGFPYGTDPNLGQTHIQFYAGRSPSLSKVQTLDSFDLKAKITSKGGFIKGKYGQIPDMRFANNPYNPAPNIFGFGPKTIWKHTPNGLRLGLPSFAA